MEIRYVRRVEMALDAPTLSKGAFDDSLPEGYFWSPWSSVAVRSFASVLHRAFRNDLDGHIFPTYRQYEACEHLILATSTSKMFAPASSWLVGRELTEEQAPRAGFQVGRPIKVCGAIVGVAPSKTVGNIHNVAVLPSARRLGLGRALLARAVDAFIEAGKRTITLEVTAENVAAVRLYSSFGFRPTKITYVESFVETERSWTNADDLGSI